jgi:hypothetical protein
MCKLYSTPRGDETCCSLDHTQCVLISALSTLPLCILEYKRTTGKCVTFCLLRTTGCVSTSVGQIMLLEHTVSQITPYSIVLYEELIVIELRINFK